MAIGRGRRRKYPTDTSEGVTWPFVTTGVAQLPVAHAHTQGNPEVVKWPLVTFGSHGTTVLVLRKKKRGKNRGMRRAYFRSGPLPVRATSGQGLFRSRDFVTSGQIAPLGRIWHNFWLRMRITYFRKSHDYRYFLWKGLTKADIAQLPDKAASGHVTNVTSVPVAPRKY